jgi:hypothetical protein
MQSFALNNLILLEESTGIKIHRFQGFPVLRQDNRRRGKYGDGDITGSSVKKKLSLKAAALEGSLLMACAFQAKSCGKRRLPCHILRNG